MCELVCTPDFLYAYCTTGGVSELPGDLLWTILGLLDLRTLCTARLVCKHVRQLGAARLKTLQLDCEALEQNATTDLRRLSSVTRLDVLISSACRLYLLAHPNIAPVITHVRLQQVSARDSGETEGLACLPLLPRLRSLSLRTADGDVSNIGLLLVGLEELEINNPSLWPKPPGVIDASLLSRLCKLTSLTSLTVDMAVGAAGSVGFLASLRNLRSLHLGCCPSVFGVLSTMPMLTSLTWVVDDSRIDRRRFFNDLTRMTGLLQLKVSYDGDNLTHEDLTCIAPGTKLTCLDLSGCGLDPFGDGKSALVPLTNLVSLGLQGDCVGLPVLATLKLEQFHGLTLTEVEGDTLVWRRATGLTHLELSCYLGNCEDSLHGLGATLVRMSGLRSLSLRCLYLRMDLYAYLTSIGLQLSLVLRALPCLTQLKCTGQLAADRDMTA
jgi:hypothetical protein